jgi:hypothetical protein
MEHQIHPNSHADTYTVFGRGRASFPLDNTEIGNQVVVRQGPKVEQRRFNLIVREVIE